MNETMTGHGSLPDNATLHLTADEQIDLLLEALFDYSRGHIQKTDLANMVGDIMEARRDR